MDQKILEQAGRKAEALLKKYPAINALILDNWRGWRFIYDTPDVTNCGNNCGKCRLYKILKDEKPGLFTAALYPANSYDKRLFGPQKNLNCKTLKQYRDCYVNFLIKSTANQAEVDEEMRLVDDLKIIYSRPGDRKESEKKFKKAIFTKAYAAADAKKRRFLKKWKDVF